MGSGKSPVGASVPKVLVNNTKPIEMAPGPKNDKVSSVSLENRQDAYKKQMENFQNLSAKNPNNSLYKQEAKNYEILYNASKNMTPGLSSYSGIDAIIAMDSAPYGSKVNIQGILFDGTYTKKNVNTAFGSGTVWIDENNHSFGTNTGTIMSELNQIKGGQLSENKNVKITFE